jgi:hypothetical protein
LNKSSFAEDEGQEEGSSYSDISSLALNKSYVAENKILNMQYLSSENDLATHQDITKPDMK